MNFISFLKEKDIPLVLLLLIFTGLKWESLSLLFWSDEYFYPHVVNFSWSFFLPWNYRPENFMGHPAGLPFISFVVFKLFGAKIYVAKCVSFSFSLLCLFNLYKMTETLFQNKWTSFLSVFFTVSIPLFWLQSTIVLGNIPLMALGFGAIYSFFSGQLKLLFLYSIGLALVRESALAFFLPLIFYSVFNSSYRKALYCMMPGMILFASHFLLCFIRTGDWFKHPHALGTLPHNLNPDWFNFSVFFERADDFIEKFFYQVSYWFWLLLLFSVVVFIFKVLSSKIVFSKRYALSLKVPFPLKNFLFYQDKKPHKSKQLLIRLLIPLFVCVQFFLFFISFPEYAFSNFYPLLLLFYPLSLYFIIKTIPFSQIILLLICVLLLAQNVFPASSPLIVKLGAGLKSNGAYKEKFYRDEILSAKSFVSYLEDHYGSIINKEKWIYMPYPYDKTLQGAGYGYVKNSYQTDHWQFFEDPERYGTVAFVRKEISRLPYNERIYSYLQNSNLFVEQPLPSHLDAFVLFINKSLLKDKQQ